MHSLDSVLKSFALKNPVLKTALNVRTSQNPNRPSGGEKQRLRKACREFEALFLSYMFKTMRKTIPQSDAENGLGKDFFTSFFDAQLAKTASEQNLGLAEMLYRELSGGLPSPASEEGSETSTEHSRALQKG